jgi:hypothetical protein
MKKIGFLLIIIFLSGCTKENIVEKEKQYRWKAQSSFVNKFAIVLNSSGTENKLNIVGYNFFSEIAPLMADEGNFQYYSKLGDNNMDYKMPVNEKIFVNTNAKTFIITPTSEAMGSNSAFIDFDKIDKDFIRFGFVYSSGGECVKINNKNQILVPYQARYGDFKFLMINLKDESASHEIDTLETKILNTGNASGYSSSIMFTHKDYFLVSLINTFKIYPDGNFSKVFDGSFRIMYCQNGILYGYTNDKIYCSYNDGETWLLSGEISNQLLLQMQYLTLDNEIILTSNSQMFHQVINNNTINLMEIDNDGLNGKFITSITKCNDKVFVTTLTGVYYIDYKDFFVYKQEGKK